MDIRIKKEEKKMAEEAMRKKGKEKVDGKAAIRRMKRD